MSKKFIVLLLFAGVCMPSFKSFAYECSAIEKKCNDFIKMPEFQNLRTPREWQSTRDLFCRVFKVEATRGPWPGVDKCLKLLDDESIPLPEVCKQSMEAMRKASQCY